MTLRQRYLDVRMGLCSGYPLCCILYFITTFNRFRIPARLHYFDIMDAVFGRSPEYVVCPICLWRRHAVVPRACTIACGHITENTGLHEGNDPICAECGEVTFEPHNHDEVES